MLFPTIDFALFFCVVYVGAWVLNRHLVAWKLWILAASYYFYAYWDWRFCFLLLGSTVIAHLGATAIRSAGTPHAKRTWLVVSLVGLLGLLGYFKYYGFFAVNVDNSLAHLGVGSLVLLAALAAIGWLGTWLARRREESRATLLVLTVAAMLVAVVLFSGLHFFSLNRWNLGHVAPLLTPTLPIAISFFTFMAVSYVVDVYRGQLEVASPIDVATYLSFFPHLVAGPIVRGSELLPQLRRPRNGREVDLSRAALLIMGGLFKKVVISSYVSANIVTPVFGAPNAHSAPEVLFAIWGYAVEIYMDFSGYTDIAIGIALLLGIKFPVNFDGPYTARSLQDFWRRWHITLSRWLRDYLYVPLGGNRGSTFVTSRNIMITMVLGGLWHGADWTFVVWGALHGTGQVVGHLRRTSRLRRGLPEQDDARLARIRQRFLTFQFVSLGWLFFNASSMSNAFAMLDRLVDGWHQPSPLVTPLLVVVLGLVIAAQYVPTRAVDAAVQWFGRLAAPLQAAALGVGLLVTTTLGPTGVQPFIYYRF